VVDSLCRCDAAGQHDLEGALAERHFRRRRVFVIGFVAAGGQQAVEAVAAPVEFFLGGDHLARRRTDWVRAASRLERVGSVMGQSGPVGRRCGAG
jgi:hypothetical protein